MSAITANQRDLTNYYQFHARLYDATRWSFLFGREHLLRFAASVTTPSNILEIGCGTGRNLEALCRMFPKASITGIDLSSAMLDQARQRLAAHGQRVKLVNRAYVAPVSEGGERYDLVVCSYALSMFNPGWEAAIRTSKADLKVGGIFALVDFHSTPLSLFRRWMAHNHVKMEGHLDPALNASFKPIIRRLSPAYAGIWHYLTFVGRKESERLS